MNSVVRLLLALSAAGFFYTAFMAGTGLVRLHRGLPEVRCIPAGAVVASQYIPCPARSGSAAP